MTPQERLDRLELQMKPRMTPLERLDALEWQMKLSRTRAHKLRAEVDKTVADHAEDASGLRTVLDLFDKAEAIYQTALAVCRSQVAAYRWYATELDAVGERLQRRVTTHSWWRRWFGNS